MDPPRRLVLPRWLSLRPARLIRMGAPLLTFPVVPSRATSGSLSGLTSSSVLCLFLVSFLFLYLLCLPSIVRARPGQGGLQFRPAQVSPAADDLNSLPYRCRGRLCHLRGRGRQSHLPHPSLGLHRAQLHHVFGFASSLRHDLPWQEPSGGVRSLLHCGN